MTSSRPFKGEKASVPGAASTGKESAASTGTAGENSYYPPENARLERHSVTLSGHRTSVSMERGLWQHLKRLAGADGLAVAELVRRIDEARTVPLSRALRAYVLTRLSDEAGHPRTDGGPL
ncbi:ribbon-helix-helix domain-containing protein [Yunchengibacter salinarum]|uniref:ribbon-helix-helix domain-containing protein n=1 Tax=Yunchengibacter salinarum TaxID=3133399 RepID=UPI0035B6A4E0